MKTGLTASLLAITLAACTTTEPAAPAPITATFACPEGERFTVTFTEGRAHLVAEGVDATLSQAISGSGYSYEGEGHALRGKGKEVIWTDPAGTQRTCDEVER